MVKISSVPISEDLLKIFLCRAPGHKLPLASRSLIGRSVLLLYFEIMLLAARRKYLKMHRKLTFKHCKEPRCLITALPENTWFARVYSTRVLSQVQFKQVLKEEQKFGGPTAKSDPGRWTQCGQFDPGFAILRCPRAWQVTQALKGFVSYKNHLHGHRKHP